MTHLEPTYLRYIYDGLIKGSIHPENEAELPEGLIGMYEEAFDERQPVYKRQQLLERFAIWALLKKEVSAQFVSEVLNQSEDEIQEFIATCSAWFNSPESGKYQLYHERLKVYLLQKLSEGEVHVLHEKLISRLERAIEEQKADEFEWYGLEFLGGHLGISAMLNGDGSKLLAITYDQNHWQRQLKFSKGYTWTKNGLREMMAWASKHNDDEVIECGLQMLDLHHQEQNAAPQIVALVAEGDFDAALKRIEQFGGNDKEGLQRKFILYMLCLMELTLLKRKDKPFRKEGIEKLLKHLDEQLPVDHSILNWNDFFSSYLIFQMACDWEELGLDYLIVYKRTDNWIMDWIKDRGPFNALQFAVLESTAQVINNEYNKTRKLKAIAIEFCNQSKLDDSLRITLGINNLIEKNTLASYFLYKKGNVTEASDLLYTALEYAQRTNDTQEIPNIFKRLIELGQFKTIYQDIIEFHKNEKYWNTIVDYTEALLKIDEIENAELLLKSFNVNKEGSKNGGDLWNKGISLNMVFNKYVDLNKFFDSELIFKEIQSPWHKITTLTYSSKAYYKIGDFNAASIKMREADDLFKENQDLNDIEYLIDNIFRAKLSIGQFEDAILLSERLEKHHLYGKCKMAIATELFALGRLSESLKIINKIDSQHTRSEALLELALILLNKGENNLFNSFLEQCEQLTLTIENINDQDAMLAKIAKGLSKNNLFFQAIQYVKLIRKDSTKSNTIFEILNNIKQNNAVEDNLKIHLELENILLSIDEEKLNEYVSLKLIAKNNFWFIAKKLMFQLTTLKKPEIYLERKYEYLNNNNIPFPKEIKLGMLIKLAKIKSRETLIKVLYTALEDAQRTNDTQEIPNIFKRLIELGQFKTIYQDIIEFHKNEKYWNTIVDYTEALLKIDEIENAELLLKSFNVNKEGSKNGGDLWNKGISLNMVFNKYVDLNKFFDSELIFKEIQSPWHKITTLTYSSKAYYKIGDFNAASIKMREADDLFKENQDLNDIEYLIDNIFRAKLSIGQFEDAILLSERLEKHHLYGKCKMAIATELFALGRLSESLKIINKIDSQHTRSEALLELALILLNKGENNLFNSFLEQCEQLTLTIENSNDQDAMLAKIAKGLSKNNQFFQAIKYVKLIGKDSTKGSALIQILENSDIPLEILQIEVCEEIVLSISNPELRQNFWFEIGNFFNSNFNFELPRSFVFFKNDEAQYFYILSWIKNIELEKIQKKSLIHCVKKMINYPEILETALQIYCLNDLFNVKTNILVSNYKRFDQTLNIKWAIDLKNNMN